MEEKPYQVDVIDLVDQDFDSKESVPEYHEDEYEYEEEVVEDIIEETETDYEDNEEEELVASDDVVIEKEEYQIKSPDQQIESTFESPVAPLVSIDEINLSNNRSIPKLEDLLDEDEINLEEKKSTFSPVDYLIKETKQKKEKIDLERKKEKLIQEQKIEQKTEKKEVNSKKNIYIKEQISMDAEESDRNQQDTNLNYVDDYSSLPYSNKVKSLSLDNINPIKIKNFKNKHSKKYR